MATPLYMIPPPPFSQPDNPTHKKQWQAAYDKLAEYVYANEPTTQSYYFGIPFDYAHDIPSTTHMFAFEAYNERDVPRHNPYPQARISIHIQERMLNRHRTYTKPTSTPPP